jgi:hypothetical protein
MVINMDRKTLISIIQEEIEDAMQERTQVREVDVEKTDLKRKARFIKERYGNRWKSIMHAVVRNEASERLDPVGDEDEDIDNDGDIDSSDRYLKNRRKTISKSLQGEEEMTDFEIKKRDRIVDRLMKQKADFKKRYDDEWETVLYATATKIAMGDSEDEEEE